MQVRENMKKFKLTFIFGFLLFLIFFSKAYSFCPKNFKSTENATFGVKICSSKKVAGQYHRHAEKVMRSLLDYDKDGKPDNKKVHENLM